MTDYRLDDQVGYLLRLASQRHVTLFQDHMPFGITPTQFTALIRISEKGFVSQNQLGRLAGMDVATIKGVVDRLREKGLVVSQPDPDDKRRALISLSAAGQNLIPKLKAIGRAITAATLAPLTDQEKETFIAALRKLG